MNIGDIFGIFCLPALKGLELSYQLLCFYKVDEGNGLGTEPEKQTK